MAAHTGQDIHGTEGALRLRDIVEMGILHLSLSGIWLLLVRKAM